MSKKCHDTDDNPEKGCCHGERCGRGKKCKGKSLVRCLFLTAGLLGALVALVYWFGRPGAQENQ